MNIVSKRQLNGMLAQMPPDVRNQYHELYRTLAGLGVVGNTVFTGMLAFFTAETLQSKQNAVAVISGTLALLTTTAAALLVKEFQHYNREITAYYASPPENASRTTRPSAERRPKL